MSERGIPQFESFNSAEILQLDLGQNLTSFQEEYLHDTARDNVDGLLDYLDTTEMKYSDRALPGTPMVGDAFPATPKSKEVPNEAERVSGGSDRSSVRVTQEIAPIDEATLDKYASTPKAGTSGSVNDNNNTTRDDNPSQSAFVGKDLTLQSVTYGSMDEDLDNPKTPGHLMMLNILEDELEHGTPEGYQMEFHYLTMPSGKKELTKITSKIKVPTHLLQRLDSEVVPWAVTAMEEPAFLKPRRRHDIWWEQWNRYWERMAYSCSCTPVLLPSHPYVEQWDMVVCWLLAYVALVTPYDTCMVDSKLDTMFFFNRIVDIGFVFDIVLQFNLAYLGPYGKFVKDRSSVVFHYLKTWFVIDVISVVPFDTVTLFAGDDISGLQSLRAVRLLKLFKMLRLLRANRLFARFEARMAINYSVMQLWLFLTLLFVLCHWLACGWYMVISIEDNVECLHLHRDFPGHCCYNWYDCYPYRDQQGGTTAARKYFLSLWWSTAEVLTLNSDIWPITPAERGYQIVVRILSGIVYAYLIGAVCSIFTTLSKRRTKFFEDMDTLNMLVQRTHLDLKDPELCTSLRLFFRFAHECSDTTTRMKEILMSLTPSLRGRLAFEVHSGWLRKLIIFSNSRISPSFFVELALALDQRILAPLENIIEPHDHAREMFIVDKGVILSKGKVYTAGLTIGEEAIWAVREDQTIRGYQATAVTHAKVNVLCTHDLFDILARPQFRVEKHFVRRGIVRAQCCQLAIQFNQVLKAGAMKDTFPAGCQEVRRLLHFVKKDKLDVIFDLFARVWHWENPDKAVNWGHMIGKMVARKNANEKMLQIYRRNKLKRNINAVKGILGKENLEELAIDIVQKEEIGATDIIHTTPMQLHIMGAPMVNAIRFHKYLTDIKTCKTEVPKDLLDRESTRRYNGVKELLDQLQLGEYTWKLAIEEEMDKDNMLKATSRQLHSAGLPLGQAMHFVKHFQNVVAQN